MNILCTPDTCPVILSATCVFYRGEDLVYSGIVTNDSIQTALQKLDAAFAGSGASIWGGITGVITNQADLIAYLNSNFYPLASNPANYISSSAVASAYVPLTRILTINGVSYDLSANRTWTITESDPVFTAWLATPPNISIFTNDAGYVTNVTASLPLSSTGGATPDISITQANSTTDGYISATDWNTFNDKQEELVSGVNIKTVNGESLLGAGDVAVSSGGFRSVFLLMGA